MTKEALAEANRIVGRLAELEHWRIYAVPDDRVRFLPNALLQVGCEAILDRIAKEERELREAFDKL